MNDYKTYQVTLVGDYFTLITSACGCDNEESAVSEAILLLSQYYGWNNLKDVIIHSEAEVADE